MVGPIGDKAKSALFMSNKKHISRKIELTHVTRLVEGKFPTQYLEAPLYSLDG